MARSALASPHLHTLHFVLRVPAHPHTPPPAHFPPQPSLLSVDRAPCGPDAVGVTSSHSLSVLAVGEPAFPAWDLSAGIIGH